MTTVRQLEANRANAKKSTGPRSPEGKSAVSTNAISHGILSTRLFLTDESPTEFGSIQDELRKALRPLGMLELALVEKIAVAIWKQRRMVAAESAFIELGRRVEQQEVRKSIGAALGRYSLDVEELTEVDLDQVKWCKKTQAEYLDIADEVLEKFDLATLAQDAPLMFGQLKNEAEEHGSDSINAYLSIYEGGLVAWAYALYRWCDGELAKQEQRPIVQAIAKLAQTERSAPITHELMMRYQIALDGELYRAMEQLRKQQEWRIRSWIEVDA